MADTMTRVVQDTAESGNPSQPLNLLRVCYDDIIASDKTAITLLATGMRQYTPRTKSLVHKIRLACHDARARFHEHHDYLMASYWNVQESARRYERLMRRMENLRHLEQIMAMPQHQPLAKEHVPYLEAFCKLSEYQIFTDLGEGLSAGIPELQRHVVLLEDWEVKKLSVDMNWLEDVIVCLNRESIKWHSFKNQPSTQQTGVKARKNFATHFACECVASSMGETMETVLKAFYDRARGLDRVSNIRTCLEQSSPAQVLYSICSTGDRAINLLDASNQTFVVDTLRQLADRWFAGPFRETDSVGVECENWRPTEQFWLDRKRTGDAEVAWLQKPLLIG